MAKRRSVYADRLLEFPDFVFSDGREFEHCGRWREHFAARMTPAHDSLSPVLRGEEESTRRALSSFDGCLTFEIGCNDAHLLAAVAAKHPTTAFVGIDWKARALFNAAERVAARRLSNVALLHARAQDLRRIFADAELDEIWLFHPEPLDNPRELPNRLIAEPFLVNVHRVLRDGGAFILKTDHRGYFESTLDLLGGMQDRFVISVTSHDFWNDATAQSAVAGRAFAGHVTAFESRFIRQRKPIYFVEIRKRAGKR